MATGQRPVFGPNDHHLEGTNLAPGLGDAEEQVIRTARGGGLVDEPPAKAALRVQAAELSAKAKQLSAVERELEKERTLLKEALDAREAALAEREALLEAQLKQLEG